MTVGSIVQLDIDFGDAPDKPTDKPTDSYLTPTLNKWKNGQKHKYRADGPCPIDDENFSDQLNFHKFGSLEAPGGQTADETEEEGTLNYAFNVETSKDTVNVSLLSYFATLAYHRQHFDFAFVDNLLQLADINTKDEHGQTLMHEIAREWNTDVAQFLYDRGLNIDVADSYGRTPLMVASASNNHTMVDWLVKHGADITAKSIGTEKRQPIHFAAMFDALDAFKMLVSLGADLNQPDDLQQTPIFFAARSGSITVCSYLLDCEVPVATYTTYGSTPVEQIVSNMPTYIALQALDQFVVVSKQMRTCKFYLSCLGKKRWHMLSVARNTCIGHLIYPTVVETIVRKKDYHLIMHPVILQYIDQCSTSYGNKYVYLNAAINILYTVVWTADVSFYNLYTIEQREVKTAKNVGIGYTVVGLLLTIWFAFALFRDYVKKSKRFSKTAHYRQIHIELRLNKIHPRWSTENHMLVNEKETNEKESLGYWSDQWVIMDLIALTMAVVMIILNFVAFRMDDVRLEKIRLYYSIFFLFAVWIRMNRALLFLESLGAFINMLGLSVTSVFQFSFLFLIVYIPYVCMIFVLFGGTRKAALATSDNYLRFNDGMYNVFLLTIGGDYDLETLVGVDSWIAKIVVGIYMIVISVICINLYVALLSESFMRVYGHARAMSLVNKADAMLSLEIINEQLEYQKESHLTKKCTPLVTPLQHNSDNESPKTIVMDANKIIKKLSSEMKKTFHDSEEMYKNFIKCQNKNKRLGENYDVYEINASLHVLQVHFSRTWYKAKMYGDSIKTKQQKAIMEVPVAMSRVKDYLVNKVRPGEED